MLDSCQMSHCICQLFERNPSASQRAALTGDERVNHNLVLHDHLPDVFDQAQARRVRLFRLRSGYGSSRDRESRRTRSGRGCGRDGSWNRCRGRNLNARHGHEMGVTESSGELAEIVTGTNAGAGGRYWHIKGRTGVFDGDGM